MASILERLSAFSQPLYRSRAVSARADRMRAHYVRSQLVQQAGAALAATDVRIAGTGGDDRHPLLRLTRRMYGEGLEHEVQMTVMHAFREFVPTLDAAIKNRRILEGEAHVESEDEALQDALNEWIDSVRVGYAKGGAAQRGLNTYADMMADNADEYGLSAGEIVTDERGQTVERLVVPNARTLTLRDQDGDGLYELYQYQARPLGQERGGLRRIDDAPFVQVLAFSAGVETPWPYPLAWSLLKSGEALMQMYTSVINGWWRFGDPSLLTVIEYPEGDVDPDMVTIARVETDQGPEDVQGPSALLLLKQALDQVMELRRQGKAADAYGFTGAGGKLSHQVIGDVKNSLMQFFREQSGVFDGHIIAHSQTPAWMYPYVRQDGDGIGGQKSQNEALLASEAAKKRRQRKERIMREAIDAHLLVSGNARYIGRYELAFEAVSIVDDKLEEETRAARAEADAQVIENAAQLFDDETGARRFAGDAERYLEENGLYPAS